MNDSRNTRRKDTGEDSFIPYLLRTRNRDVHQTQHYSDQQHECCGLGKAEFAKESHGWNRNVSSTVFVGVSFVIVLLLCPSAFFSPVSDTALFHVI